MPAKMARSAPSAAVRGARITAAVRAARRSCQNAATAQKIHPGLGFIWGIPDYMCSRAAPLAGRPTSKPLFLRCTCSVSAKIS